MPEYPDVSYQAWASQYGRPGMSGTRLENALYAWGRNYPSYENWRTNQLDDYNAKMSAYNTWLGTGAGIRASSESGDYNPSYFQAGSQASASPLNYENVDSGPGFNEMAQGISGIISFIAALQNMKLQSAQIRGIDLKNQQQAIENQFLPTILSGRGSQLGYQNDWLNLRNTTELYSRYKDLPELWKNGVFSPFGTMTYDLRGTDKGLQYQKAFQDIDFLKAGTALRSAQKEMTNWNAKEKKFYVESIQSIYKEFLDTQLGLAKGELSFQKLSQDLKKRAVNWGIGISTANTIIGVAKTVAGFMNPAVGAVGNAMSSFERSTYTDPFPVSGYLGY